MSSSQKAGRSSKNTKNDACYTRFGVNVRKAIPLSMMLIAMLACAIPSFGTPQPQAFEPLDVNSLETIIVQTAAAAQTQTATFLPSPTVTPSPTLTLTPSPVPTMPTATPTFLYFVTPFIAVETSHPGYSSSGSGGSSGSGSAGSGGTPVNEPVPYSGKPWTCVVRGTSPPRGSFVDPGKEFYVTWTVLNTGTKTWTTTTIDFLYRTGYRHEGKPIQDLWKNVRPGQTINLQVLFKAPRAPGEYRAYWHLQVGNFPFCQMVAHFEVK
jgi:hypothetical protein